TRCARWRINPLSLVENQKITVFFNTTFAEISSKRGVVKNLYNKSLSFRKVALLRSKASRSNSISSIKKYSQDESSESSSIGNDILANSARNLEASAAISSSVLGCRSSSS